MSNYKNNGSSIGTATHTEKHFKLNGDSRKKSRHKCQYYEQATQDCIKLRISCVGPSNKLCRYYSENKKTVNNLIGENQFVYHEKYGVGIIIRVEQSVYEVGYAKDNKKRLYNEREIKELIRAFRK